MPVKRDTNRGRRSLSQVVADGDRRASLVALRDHLARALETAEGHGTAALAKQLADVLRELDQIEPAKESRLDDLRARRAARESATTG